MSNKISEKATYFQNKDNLNEYESKSKREFIINDNGRIQPLPCFNKSVRMFIAGATGSGKNPGQGQSQNHRHQPQYPQGKIVCTAFKTFDCRAANG